MKTITEIEKAISILATVKAHSTNGIYECNDFINATRMVEAALQWVIYELPPGIYVVNAKSIVADQASNLISGCEKILKALEVRNY